MEMTNTLNWRCHVRMSRKITLPKKLIFSLNFSTDEYKLAIIFPRKGPKSLNKAMVYITIKYYTGYFRKNIFSVADNGRQKC